MVLGTVALRVKFGFNILFYKKDFGAEMEEC